MFFGGPFCKTDELLWMKCLSGVSGAVYGDSWCRHETSRALDRGILVFLLRAVLFLVKLGSIRDQDTNIRLLYHVFELSLVAILYGIVSHVFAYGHTTWKDVNNRSWLDAAASNMADAVSGWTGVVTATVLGTSMVAGHLQLTGCVSAAILMAAFLDPIIIHWAWSSKGLSHTYELGALFTVYEDVEVPGCASVHVLTGVVATIAIIYVLVRCLTLKNTYPRKMSLSSNTLGAGMLSSMFLIVCMLGLCMPYAFNQMTHEFGKYIGGNVSSRILIIWHKINQVFYPHKMRAIDIETGLLQPFGLRHVYYDVSTIQFGISRHVVISIEGKQSYFN